jgi:hypothetical protein
MLPDPEKKHLSTEKLNVIMSLNTNSKKMSGFKPVVTVGSSFGSGATQSALVETTIPTGSKVNIIAAQGLSGSGLNRIFMGEWKRVLMDLKATVGSLQIIKGIVDGAKLDLAGQGGSLFAKDFTALDALDLVRVPPLAATQNARFPSFVGLSKN